MKKYILTFILILPLTLFAQKNSIIFKGKVADPEVKTIKLLVNNLFSDDRTIISERLNSEGTFTFQYDQKYPHDNYVEYNDKLYRFFSAPGDTLYAEINNGKIFFSGSNKTLNNEFQTFKIRENYELWLKVNDAQKKLSPSGYKNKLFEIQAETDSLLDQYFEANNSSAGLQEWERYYYKYRTIDDLMRYSMFNPDTVISDNYYDFLFDSEFLSINPTQTAEFNIPINPYTLNSRVFMCSMTNSIIDEVSLYLAKQTGKLNPDYKSLKKGYDLYLNTIINFTQGPMREIQITKLFNRLIEWKQFKFIEENLSLFFTYVKNDSFRKIILEEYGKKKREISSNDINQYLAYYSNDIIIAPVIDSILTTNLSKVIYIDFWATWCGPCIGEMSCYRKLKTMYTDKDVVFIYLCVDSKENNWKLKIDELHIDGQHYLLSQEQYDIMADIFQIDGVPHHVLINKNGKIVEREACSPCDSYLKVQLDKVLNE